MDSTDPMGRMRQELGETSPDNFAVPLGATGDDGFGSHPSPVVVSAGYAGPASDAVLWPRTHYPQRLRGTYRVALWVAVLHPLISLPFANGTGWWATWGRALLQFPTAWAQPLVLAIAGCVLLILVKRSPQYLPLSHNQYWAALNLRVAVGFAAAPAIICSFGFVVGGLVYLLYVGFMMLPVLARVVVVIVVWKLLGKALS
ncbi:MAG TPA: hypothetical protein PLX71_06095 [Phycicoccus sp.]|nr:hypothetical protein [Phycicoccus sp.]